RDEAHAPVRGDAELIVVAETRNVDACPIGDLDQHLALARLERHAVHFDLDYVVAHVRLRGARQAAALKFSTMLRPRCSTMYSNSCRKCLRKLWTGHAAASPNAQIVCPAIVFATSTSRSRSARVPLPPVIRVSTRCSQPVPSRHGVH